MNLEQWLTEGQKLQNALNEAQQAVYKANEESSRLNTGVRYLLKQIGEDLLKNQLFIWVRSGSSVDEALRKLRQNGQEISQEKTQLLRETGNLYQLETELKQATIDAETAQKAFEDAAELLEAHSTTLPADAVQQLAECRAESKRLSSEIERLDATICRVESQPAEDAAAAQKLIQVEASYSNALADAELNPDDKKLASQAEKLRAELESAKQDAIRPGDERQHKLNALRNRKSLAHARQDELDAIVRRAIAATHEPRLSQSRAAIAAVIQKHLIPAIGKHNALVQLLDDNAPYGTGYSQEKIKLDLISKILEAVGIGEEGQECHIKAMHSESDKLHQAIDIAA